MATLPANRNLCGETVRLFGLPISRMTQQQTLAWLEKNVLQPEGVRSCVFSANVDQIIRYHSDPILREAFAVANLIVPDGMPVVWAGQWLGQRLPERVTGIDLLCGVCDLAARRGHRCFLLGSRPEVAARAAENLCLRFPGLNVCGWHHGYFHDDRPVVDVINSAGTDVLFVGMGSPRQENWLRQNFDRLPCRLAMPVGGSFEVIAGLRKRAPVLFQKMGMEWCWRLYQEPRRLWRRYLIEDLKFLNLVAKEVQSRRAAAVAAKLD